MEEYLDLYDKNNNSLGMSKKRSEVHRDGDWHRTAHIYIVNDQGQFLVHLRSPFKDAAPNKWDSRFGGHVRAGKTYAETAVDELREEIGLKVNIDELIVGPTFHYESKTNNEHIQSYIYKFNGDIKNFKFNDNEVVEVKWLSLPEIEESLRLNREIWGSMLIGIKEVSEQLGI